MCDPCAISITRSHIEASILALGLQHDDTAAPRAQWVATCWRRLANLWLGCTRHRREAMKTTVRLRHTIRLALSILVLMSATRSQIRAAPLVELPEYCHSTSAINEEDHLLSAKIAMSLSLLPPSDARLLGTFYGVCDDAPAWVSNGKVTP